MKNIKVLDKRQQGFVKILKTHLEDRSVVWFGLLQSLSERDLSNKEVESGNGFFSFSFCVFFLVWFVKNMLNSASFALLLIICFSFLDFVCVYGRLSFYLFNFFF